ncbi:Prefoldin subunit-domain-containing protein [Phaeosphaeria sp. MPI-PUGE-AT-0046c]|nr:Prefoldin subunit-domain-containing protein [Phaeosphaeria sp. MPI-PUGE-AT-0046c]
MAASTQDALDGIERRRAQLQQNVDKLRRALTHWSTWEAEYQELADEIHTVEDASPAQIREIAQRLDSTLLDSKEVEELLGKDPHTKRSANQVVDMIFRRIDYVQQNSATIEKQLDVAEKHLAGVDLLLDPGVENEEGLPMMDIEEELDDEGNEVGSSVNQTGKAAAEVVEVLRKAGLQKAQATQQASAPPARHHVSDIVPKHAPPKASAEDTPSTPKEPQDSTPSSQGSLKQVAEPSKKSVSFAEDTKPAVSSQMATLQRDGYNEDLVNMNFTRGTKVIELDEDYNEVASYPIIPQGESPEDAELRRQMLQYGLSEVGQVVAELDLDHPVAEFSEDEDDYDEETDDENEDQYGRSTRPVIDEDYRKQMLELEKKLNARMMENVGPQGEGEDLAEHANDIRTLRIRDDDKFDQLSGSANAGPDAGPDAGPARADAESKKKGVRFAENLDISDAPPPALQASKISSKPAPAISDTIMERPVTVQGPANPPTKAAKVSRFKSSRAGISPQPQVLPTPPMPEPQAVPSGPAGRTLATTVVEHDLSTTMSAPNAPDEFDPVTLNREIQTEYHKARNKFIQQQGGFTPTLEDEESPLMEEKDGKTKKVSRFLAARLKGSGV